MGGAARSARKKRQAQSAGTKAVAAAARNNGDRTKVIIGVVVVVVLLIAVIGGVIIYNNNKNTTEDQQIQPATGSVSVDYPVRREDAVVVAGSDDAKVTLDVYEDFLCPACRSFEDEFGDDLSARVADGTVQVRYHMLPMLNDQSDPTGYSLDSANAGLCAADAGEFPAFHESLFNNQPEEGARGWDEQQLTELGSALGITTPEFATCVSSGQHDAAINTHFEQVRNTDYLQQDFNGQRGFGTPTIAAGEKVVKPSDPQWLDKLISAS